MEKILDAGFCLPAACPLVPVRLAMLGKRVGLVHGRRVGFVFRRGGRRYWIFKGNYLFLSSIKYPVSETS
jgi:hypothetical protein